MLVLDTSAVVAVVFGEADGEAFLAAMVRHVGEIAISAATLVELRVVVEGKRGAPASSRLSTLLSSLAVTVEPVDEELAGTAIVAWRRFGKGRHPAGLNFGDCFSYALAKQSGASLLFKGGDFSQTDIASAL